MSRPFLFHSYLTVVIDQMSVATVYKGLWLSLDYSYGFDPAVIGCMAFESYTTLENFPAQLIQTQTGFSWILGSFLRFSFW